MKSRGRYILLALVVAVSAWATSCTMIGGAEFETILQASPDPVEGGAVTPSEGSYKKGVNLLLTAIPAPGWEFTGWSGDTAVATNPLTLTMNGDKTLTANFIQIQQEFEETVTVNNGIDSIDVTFGMALLASDGIDSMDEEYPPPPIGSFYAASVVQDFYLRRDIRALTNEETAWQLYLQPGESSSIVLNWNFSQTSHKGSLVLTDHLQDPSFEIDMKANNSFQLPDPNINTLYIVSRP